MKQSIKKPPSWEVSGHTNNISLESLLVLLESDSCHVEKRIAQEYMRVKIKWYNNIMKHLFLTSIDIAGFLEYINKPAKELKFAYTPTAANVEDNTWFIDEDKRKLQEAGITLREFNLRNVSDGKAEEELHAVLSDIDVLIMSGGNTFYLLQEVYRTKFDQVVQRLVENGVWYVGGSAGAALAGSTIEPLSLMDDPALAPHLSTFSALGLADFVIVPHTELGHYAERANKAIEICKQKQLRYVPINDSQSILVEGEDWKIVQVKK